MSDSNNKNDFENVITSIKNIDSVDLFKLLKVVISEIEKKTKHGSKGKPVKKAGSAPKGVSPPQLKKPRAWVEYTLKDVLKNGWEPFTIHQKKKDKITGIVTTEEIKMPCSIFHNGAHVYDGSIDEKNPEGKSVKHKESMSLSKQRKDTGHHTYATFDAQYADDSSESDDDQIQKEEKKMKKGK